MNDSEIIQKTKVVPDDEGEAVTLTLELPDGEVYKQKAQNADSAKKHIMAWCESVRNHWEAKQAERQEEMLAAKARRKSGLAQEKKPQEPVSAMRPDTPNSDPRVTVLEWYEATQARIDELSEMIEACKDERDTLRDERDKIAPIIKAWGKGGESND